jgi:hypothetical protein
LRGMVEYRPAISFVLSILPDAAWHERLLSIRQIRFGLRQNHQMAIHLSLRIRSRTIAHGEPAPGAC